jgi:hypothetical protein
MSSKLLKLVLVIFALVTLIPLWNQPHLYWIPGIFIGMIILTMLRIPEKFEPWIMAIFCSILGVIMFIAGIEFLFEGRVPVGKTRVFVYRENDPVEFYILIAIGLSVAIGLIYFSFNFYKKVLTLRSRGTPQKRGAP